MEGTNGHLPIGETPWNLQIATQGPTKERRQETNKTSL